ncbi:pali-domain-containing protein [Pholiota conissans]|uniref:Pali-domain-containing protein n=1 Tax=Pholiota conissans TaxID=109636 RepID=A0A9P6CT73_9AGAR|nr:pali-domain-containing protein [Pholiota conissans]
MAASSAIPGLFFCFCAMTLLIFASVAVPTWNAISFLNIGPNGGTLKYGIFGFTGSSTSVGYFFSNEHVNSGVLHNLTKTLILHPIAAGLSGFAFFFGLIGAAYHRVGTVLMTLTAGLALLTTFVVWIIDMVLFGIARQRYRNDGDIAQYGNGNWLTLAALFALLLGFCTSACGIFGHYRRRRDVAY